MVLTRVHFGLYLVRHSFLLIGGVVAQRRLAAVAVQAYLADRPVVFPVDGGFSTYTPVHARKRLVVGPMVVQSSHSEVVRRRKLIVGPQSHGPLRPAAASGAAATR
ncbi:hypothetical protein O0L34_g3082 [Tuta absoluta]|nr:hypothetical protein O0L34_g3082 [Tuta absoluta]